MTKFTAVLLVLTIMLFQSPFILTGFAIRFIWRGVGFGSTLYENLITWLTGAVD